MYFKVKFNAEQYQYITLGYGGALRYLNPLSLEMKPTTLQIYLAGLFGGMLSTILTSPFELLKCQQQNSHSRESKSLYNVFKEVIRIGGIRNGLYRYV